MNTNEIGWIGRYGSKLLAMIKEHDPDKYTCSFDVILQLCDDGDRDETKGVKRRILPSV